MLASLSETAIEKTKAVEALEGAMLDLPQVECPVVHHFGPGVYIREVTIPAGALAIGHAQRFEHLNIMLAGSVTMADDDGNLRTLKAPLIFVGKPGRKMGLVLETCIWQNVYPNIDEERDIEKLEAKWLDKSATWQAYDNAVKQFECAARQEDREDFDLVIKAAGFSPETVREQSEHTGDQMTMPEAFAAIVSVRPSPIEGKGLFVSRSIGAGEIIAPARINGLRTPAGRYTNHAKKPNAKFVKDDSGTIWLVASKDIRGCCGGDQGEEITVDYRQALVLSGIRIEGEQK